ncbi:MAG: hypothetical protein PHT84_04535 [Candidatus Pacebacteria bacterium]|nr:hypothetical protein [Candidatus Paceibacterota bacterium]
METSAKLFFSVNTTATQFSIEISSTESSIISISASSLSRGIVVSTSFHFIISFLIFPSVTITHFSSNCQETDHCCHKEPQNLLSVVFTFVAVLFVFQVNVLIIKALHEDPYHS